MVVILVIIVAIIVVLVGIGVHFRWDKTLKDYFKKL